MSNPFLNRFNTALRGSRGFQPPNIADLGFWWDGQYDGESLINKKGINIPYVSGAGLDAIYDFEVLGDARLDKSNATYWTQPLDAYFYYDVGNPYHSKLQDFHYRYTENQMASDNNFIFLKASSTTNTSNIIASIFSLLIYSTEQTDNNLSTLKTYIGIQNTFFSDELVTSLVNGTLHPFETAIISGINITSAINTVANASIYDNAMNLDLTTGDEFISTFDFVLNSGQSPNVLLMQNGDAISGSSSNIINPTTGSYDVVLTANATGAGRELVVYNTAASDWEMTNILLKQKYENYYGFFL